MPTVDYTHFHNYNELLALLRAFTAGYPQYIALSIIGRSHEGRDIPLLTVTNTATGPAEHKPAYWLDGNIHSIELSGCSACVYFIDWLMQHKDSNADVSRCLDTRAFYICPRINPDGAELALAPRPRFIRSSTRRYPWDEDPVSGLLAEDIDGDGHILQMRMLDANGAWKEHPDEPRLLVRREPTDHGGRYYRVMSEGRIEQFDGVTIELAGAAGNAQALDLNRNFPAKWRQEFEQLGAGPYPTSEPEVHAVVAFISAHPNICGGTSMHTYSGVLLRPFGDLPDDKMPAEDLWVYQAQGKKGEALTGYPAVSVYHDFAYKPGEFIGGTFDWLYEHLGCFVWTVEIWNPKKEAGIADKNWIDWFRDHPIEHDLQLLRWADKVAPSVGYVDWRPFDHPQLGRVELGGWNKFALFVNPPPAQREQEFARFPQWLLWNALISPKLELREVQVTALSGDIWRVRLIVQNSGWLPTYVSKMAEQRKLLCGVLAEIELPAGAELLQGKPREALGELEGWSSLHSGISFWPIKKPTQDLGFVDWVVRAESGTGVKLNAWHERAGRIVAKALLTH